MKNKVKVLIIILLMSSCSQNPDILSKKEFINMLVDVHIVDGYLVQKSMFDKDFTENDSLSYYNSVFKKHNINRRLFQQNIYYYADNLVEYENIYIEVVKILKKKKEVIDSLKRYAEPDPTNLWNKKLEIKIPEDGINDSVFYKIKIKKHAIYTINAEYRFMPDDKTIKPYLKICANYKDDSQVCKKINVNQKNKKWTKYSISVKTDTTKELKTISGVLLEHTEGANNKHVKIRDIVINQNVENENELIK